MFPLRKLIAAAALAAVALFAAPGQQAQATTLVDGSTLPAVIGEDYTFNTVLPTPTSVPIGPVSYAFTFTPGTADTVVTAVFEYSAFLSRGQVPFTGGFVSWSNGGIPITQALVDGVRTTLPIHLSAAGPDQTLTIGFDAPGAQTGTGFVVGKVDVAAIPLPASGFLLLAGLGAIAVVRRQAVRLAA